MKRLISTLLIVLLVAGNILLLASPSAKSGVKVSPAKLTITIEDYPEKEIHYKIKVTNPYSHDLRVTSRVIHPWDLTDNYMRIPDLSWIKILPETLDIPAGSYKEFEVILDIPKSEKILHYNESWETWVLIIPKRPLGVVGGSGAVIQIQLGVRLFIHTPTGTMKMQIPENLYLIIGIIIGFIALAFVYFYVRKKKSIEANGAAMFYIKKKDGSVRHNKKN